MSKGGGRRPLVSLVCPRGIRRELNVRTDDHGAGLPAKGKAGTPAGRGDARHLSIVPGMFLAFLVRLMPHRRLLISWYHEQTNGTVHGTTLTEDRLGPLGASTERDEPEMNLRLRDLPSGGFTGSDHCDHLQLNLRNDRRQARKIIYAMEKQSQTGRGRGVK
jgi:hypothetical protein